MNKRIPVGVLFTYEIKGMSLLFFNGKKNQPNNLLSSTTIQLPSMSFHLYFQIETKPFDVLL